MIFTKKQLTVARIIEKSSIFYQEMSLSDERYKKQFKDSYTALELFLDHFAHERQGASPAYKKLALNCIKEIFNHNLNQINPNSPKNLWDLYYEKAKSKNYKGISFDKSENPKLNDRNNPMNADKGIIYQLLDIEDKDKNLALYIKKLLEEDEVKKAHEFMTEIKGIGDKISSFYLRDIAYLIKLDEKKIEDTYLLQPIDIWVRRVHDYFFPTEKNLKDIGKARNIVKKLCLKNKLSPIRFNQGAWYFGSAIARNSQNLTIYLDNPDKIQEKIQIEIKLREKFLDEIHHVF